MLFLYQLFKKIVFNVFIHFSVSDVAVLKYFKLSIVWYQLIL